RSSLRVKVILSAANGLFDSIQQREGYFFAVRPTWSGTRGIRYGSPACTDIELMTSKVAIRPEMIVLTPNLLGSIVISGKRDATPLFFQMANKFKQVCESKTCRR